MNHKVLECAISKSLFYSATKIPVLMYQYEQFLLLVVV